MAAALACAVLCAAVPDRAAAQLPDLVPEIFGIAVQVQNVPQGDVIEGCAGGTTGRRLIRFGLRSRNVGAADLVLGNPGCPDCVTHPGASCTNPLFICSPAHGHVHFESFAHAELLDGNGTVIVEGHKDGFCLLDSECPSLNYTCSNQGLTAGCADVYTPQTPCQYIDVTDTPLPPGTYTLRVMVDPDNALAEANETNNTTTATVQIGSGPPTPTPVVTPQPLCLAAPRSPCHEPRTSQVRMRDPTGDNSDRIAWSWLRGQTTKAAFGNPLTVTRYALCLYDESQPAPTLLASAQVAAQGLCGRRPCWRAVGTQGFTYVDGRGTSDGVMRIQLKRGPRGEGRIVVRAKGAGLSLPTLPITPYNGVRAQLVNSDGECWEATYSPPALRNTAVDFKDETP